MDAPRIIKKYPNRRLYDTELSRYVTLDEVKELVLKNVPFMIIDDNAADMTNYVLLQILTQEENSQSPLFTKEILQSLICFYGHPLQKNMSQFLEKGLSIFTEQEPKIQEYFENLVTEDESFSKIATAAKRNLDIWQSVLAQFLDKEKQNP